MNWESFLKRVKESDLAVFYVHSVYPMDSVEFLSLSPSIVSAMDSDTGKEFVVFNNFNSSASISVSMEDVKSSKVMNNGASIVCIKNDGVVVYISAYKVGSMAESFFNSGKEEE